MKQFVWKKTKNSFKFLPKNAFEVGVFFAQCVGDEGGKAEVESAEDEAEDGAAQVDVGRLVHLEAAYDNQPKPRQHSQPVRRCSQL